jgi:predicted secreted protein
MDTLFAIALYIFIWWITLFVVLPFGVHTQDDEGIVVPGTPESAPFKPHIVRAFLINTVLASVVFGIVYIVIVYKLIDPEKLQFF